METKEEADYCEFTRHLVNQVWGYNQLHQNDVYEYLLCSFTKKGGALIMQGDTFNIINSLIDGALEDSKGVNFMDLLCTAWHRAKLKKGIK